MTAQQSKSLAAIFAIAAFANGCGGGGDSSNEGIATSSLSKSQFVKQANALCIREKTSAVKKVIPSIQKLRSEGLPELDAALKTMKTILVPMSETQIAGIRDLGAPAGDEKEIGAALEAQEEALDELKEQDKLKNPEETSRAFAEPTAILKSYGLEKCIFSL
jgi:hypothetical protein